jgi:hypothetical protein
MARADDAKSGGVSSTKPTEPRSTTNNTRPTATAVAMTAQMGQNLGLGNDQRAQTWMNITGHSTGEIKALV